MNKIRRNRNYTFIDHRDNNNNDNISKSNKQGEALQNYSENPSNGQDEASKLVDDSAKMTSEQIILGSDSKMSSFVNLSMK